LSLHSPNICYFLSIRAPRLDFCFLLLAVYLMKERYWWNQNAPLFFFFQKPVDFLARQGFALCRRFPGFFLAEEEVSEEHSSIGGPRRMTQKWLYPIFSHRERKLIYPRLQGDSTPRFSRGKASNDQENTITTSRS